MDFVYSEKLKIFIILYFLSEGLLWILLCLYTLRS